MNNAAIFGAFKPTGGVVTFVSSSNNGTYGASCNKPSGLSASDTMIADVTYYGSLSGTASSSGWTSRIKVIGTNAGLPIITEIFTAPASLGAGPFSWTLGGGSSDQLIIISGFSGVNATTPIGNYSTYANDFNPSFTFSSITVTSNNSYTMIGGSGWNRGVTVDTSGWTLIAEIGSGNESQGFRKAANAGSTGTVQCTKIDPGTETYAGAFFEVKPA